MSVSFPTTVRTRLEMVFRFPFFFSDPQSLICLALGINASPNSNKLCHCSQFGRTDSDVTLGPRVHHRASHCIQPKECVYGRYLLLIACHCVRLPFLIRLSGGRIRVVSLSSLS